MLDRGYLYMPKGYPTPRDLRSVFDVHHNSISGTATSLMPSYTLGDVWRGPETSILASRIDHEVPSLVLSS